MKRTAIHTELSGPQKVILNLTGVNGAVKARQRIEQTIVLVTAQALLDAGFSLGVNDGGETTLEFSRDLDAIKAALFTTDDDYLYVYKAGRKPSKDNRPDGWVRFVYGNDGWDVISDCSSVDDLDPIIGDGTVVQKLSDYACDNGVVPDLFYRNNKVTVAL